MTRVLSEVGNGRGAEMTNTPLRAGYLAGGLPYNRLGSGPRPLVVLQGLMFENKPLPGIMGGFINGSYRFLTADYTVWVVTRRPGLPRGFSLADMASDYASMIRQEFGGPLDVVGLSTGGSIAQHLAADHPDVVRRLVIHSSAYTLNPDAKQLQLAVAEFAAQRRWRDAWGVFLDPMFPQRGPLSHAGKVLARLSATLVTAIDRLEDPSDLIITVIAEDSHDFRDRLGEISVPTLVAGGERDPFYSEGLFTDTAAGIPGALLRIYPGQGHPASGREFARDVLGFLRGR